MSLCIFHIDLYVIACECELLHFTALPSSIGGWNGGAFVVHSDLPLLDSTRFILSCLVSLVLYKFCIGQAQFTSDLLVLDYIIVFICRII